MSELISPQGDTLFADDFTGGLGHWHHEGTGVIGVCERAGRKTLRLDCTGRMQGGAGCQAFCRQDFPDGIAVEFDLLVQKSNGLVITFLAMRGLNGEDVVSELPARRGVFADYVADEAAMRSYHVSVSRYDDEGVHTGVSNWRRNPGLHLMGHGPDLCRRIRRQYAVRIVKDGAHLQLGVDGALAHEFTDPCGLPDRLPEAGKVGFRAIGSLVIAEIGEFRVRLLRRPEDARRRRGT